MRDIAIVTGVLVLRPIAEAGEEKIAKDAIILDEDLSDDAGGE